MARKRPKPAGLARRLERRAELRIRVGEFPMAPSPTGVARKVRIEFPHALTTQEKYDVATALAKGAQALVAEADAEREAAEGLARRGSLRLVEP